MRNCQYDDWRQLADRRTYGDRKIKRKKSLGVDGAEGIGALAESFGKQHDMQVHVILNPQHERARFVTPLSPSQIQEGLHHVYKANETL